MGIKNSTMSKKIKAKSGPKFKYGEETVVIAARIPKSRVNHVKSILKTLCDGWRITP